MWSETATQRCELAQPDRVLAWAHLDKSLIGSSKSVAVRLRRQGDYLELEDMAGLQGVDLDKLKFEDASVSRAAMAGMLGNAVSGSVLKFLIPQVLLVGGWMCRQERKALREQSEVRYRS